MSKLRLIAATGRFGQLTKLFGNTKNERWMSSVQTEDKITHTGQVKFYKIYFLIYGVCNLQQWDADDYRMVRYVDKTKLVSQNIAIDLIDEVPPKVCTDRVVWCDGGSGPTGHPRVYINLVGCIFIL